jgi:phosphoribosylamine--glycine ligase
MKVLIIGSGGREHALAWKIAASPLCEGLFVAPGNPGTAHLGRNVAATIEDHDSLVGLCRKEGIDFVVVGPEAPLVAGLVDHLECAGIAAFGPSRAAARLEGSKAFAREIAREAGVPGAEFAVFTDAEAARAHIRLRTAPIVVKADGLAAGKGVVVAETREEALAAIDMMAAGGLGAAGATILIEECLIGEEISFFALCDGENALPLGSAQDHKRAYDGDKGPNTGGMGAYSPAPIMTPDMEKRVMDDIVAPVLRAMKARGTPFLGILFAGLMITAHGPRLIEFNVRFGDPECQALLPRIKGDLLAALRAARDGRLGDVDLGLKADHALCVVYAAKGYPGKVETGTPISGIERAEALPSVQVFHAGTALRGTQLAANGGRVLGITATGPTLREAADRAYGAAAAIDWPGGFYRRDIGWRALAGT